MGRYFFTNSEPFRAGFLHEESMAAKAENER
jgi:hypothetical protein